MYKLYSNISKDRSIKGSQQAMDIDIGRRTKWHEFTRSKEENRNDNIVIINHIARRTITFFVTALFVLCLRDNNLSKTNYDWPTYPPPFPFVSRYIYIYYNEIVVCLCAQLPNCNLFRTDGTQPPVNNLNVNLLINDTNCFSKLSFMDFSIHGLAISFLPFL